MTPEHAAHFFDPLENRLDADRMRASGLAALCRADVMDLDSLVALPRVLGGAEGPFFVAGATFGTAFRPAASAPLPELVAARSHALLFSHRLYTVGDVWACFEPDEGDYHVIFGEGDRFRRGLRALAPDVEREWLELNALPPISDTAKAHLAAMRARYTFGF